MFCTPVPCSRVDYFGRIRFSLADRCKIGSYSVSAEFPMYFIFNKLFLTQDFFNYYNISVLVINVDHLILYSIKIKWNKSLQYKMWVFLDILFSGISITYAWLLYSSCYFYNPWKFSLLSSQPPIILIIAVIFQSCILSVFLEICSRRAPTFI